jgi:hypothetical protein
MDPGYVSAISALAGSAIGGLTSLMASWLTHHVQFSSQERETNRNRRVDLYKSFIEEASKWYADAYEHDQARVSDLVTLYALIGRMRVLSSQEVIESADRVVRTIIQTYLAPNKTFRELAELLDNHAKNPLRDFGDACRREFRGPDPT